MHCLQNTIVFVFNSLTKQCMLLSLNWQCHRQTVRVALLEYCWLVMLISILDAARLIFMIILLQAAVGWEYEGKTEAHASQKGAFKNLINF